MLSCHFDAGDAVLTGIAFDAQLCLIDSAQAFHWTFSQGGYVGAPSGRAARITPLDGSSLRISPCTADELPFWLTYLDLERDYAALAEEYAGYPILTRALGLLPGLRILRQDPWEALVTFLLSANNNTSRIRALVRALNERFGELFVLPDGARAFGFPSPARLMCVPEEELRALKLGYRAPYLLATARAVSQGAPELSSLCERPYEEAHAALVCLAGVGDKVADCVQLFGMGFFQAFPVDVWVDRLMRAWFGCGQLSRRQIGAEARRLLGDHAGIAQQFLFHCARTGLLPLEPS